MLIPTMKFVCPKMNWKWDNVAKKSKRICHCDNPCTTSSCGRMIYVYTEQNLRAYPGCIRDSDEWDSTYKIRINVEKSINHFKDILCVTGRKTQNEKTLHADLLLAGLLTVMVADKIHNYKYIRSLNLLIAYVYFLYIILQADIPICFVFVLPFSFCIPVIKKLTMKVVFSLYTLIKQVCFAITYLLILWKI